MVVAGGKRDDVEEERERPSDALPIELSPSTSVHAVCALREAPAAGNNNNEQLLRYM